MVVLKRLLTNIYVFIYTIFLKFTYKPKKSDKVLIVVDGLIGDTILIQDFLKECDNYFQKQKRLSVDIFFSKPFVKKFYLECCDTYGFIVLEIDFAKKNAELMDMLNVLRYFKNKEYEYILNPLPKHKGDKLVGCIKGKYKYSVRDDLNIKGRGLSNLFRRIAYSETKTVPKTEMEFCRYKLLLNMAGDVGYRTALPQLKKNSPVVLGREKYCVFAVGASEIGKKWPLDRFVRVAKFVCNNYGIKIVFVGGVAESRDIQYITNQIDEGCYIDFSGKTSYSEWVEIIREAVFVLGNDSASIHIAAATETPSVCVVGKWQYKRFYPYNTDINNKILPIPVFCRQTLECENCGKVLDLMPNKECKATVKTQRSYKCLEAVEASRVEYIVKRVMDEI